MVINRNNRIVFEYITNSCTCCHKICSLGLFTFILYYTQRHIPHIVDTNIIVTLNKIELLGCRRFNERPNSLYYYYSVHQLPMGQLVDTFLIGTLWMSNSVPYWSFEVAFHVILNFFYYFIKRIIPIVPRFF